MEMQLIIKAPNQNVDDQVINCDMDWTILKLKKHLSEVYPNKPSLSEQKLIYSGRLLHDHLQLKDVVRHEDNQSSVHIIHLVCNGSSHMSGQDQNIISVQDLSNEIPVIESGRLSATNTETSENNLRYRSHSSVPPINFQEMPVSSISTFPVYSDDPQALAQVAAMQQMYAEYITQYWQSMNMAASAGNLHTFPVVPNLQPQQNNQNNASNEPAVAQQPANQRFNAFADAAPDENNEFGNRDWLDQLFLYCRFLVLLSIVYFYSTPERFMLVILCMVIAFLYREGWFMRRTLAEAVMRHRNIQREVVPNAANNANEQALSNQDGAQNGHELEAAMDGEDPPHAQNPDVVNNNHVFSPLSFLIMFFSSLIPEPPPPVNIN